jgi:chorismate mutase/prephenate dehydratase
MAAKKKDSTPTTAPPNDSSPPTSQLERSLQALDRQLVQLLNQRARQTQELAKHLTDDAAGQRRCAQWLGGDWARNVEQALASSAGPLAEPALHAIFRELTCGCRELTHPVRAAFLGPLHSYSHLAAIEYFGTTAELIPVGTIAAVFEEVTEGNNDYGLVPLENSTDGRIVDTLDMFTRVRVKISGEVPLRIHHNLLGIGSRNDIETVCSKPQALSQCRSWLAKHLPHAAIVETPSTTAAAERAKLDRRVAAIASRQAASNYGLKLLAENIEDNKNNITRFAVIGQSTSPRTGHDKTSIFFQLEHQPGTLADVMAIFKRQRLNMTWIESFPLVGRTQEYHFFVEFQGHESDLRVRRALSALEKKTQRLELLGSYPIGNPVG